MEQKQIREFVKQKLDEGISLSDIQKELQTIHGVKITFLELRLLASEIEEVDWAKQKSDKVVEETNNETQRVEAEVVQEKGTAIEISKIKRPGAMVSGSVKFASGAKAEWIIDQLGRLRLENKTGNPTAEDIQEFQTELQSVLGNGQ